MGSFNLKTKITEHDHVLTAKQEDFLNRYTEGSWKLNPSTGLVDVDGDFDCSGKGLKTLAGIKFGNIGGDFYCYHNKLTSLAGAPQTVVGNFSCSYNGLTSLEGAPQTVSGYFRCHENKLTSLAGATQTVGGKFECYYNKLTSLAGAPQSVDGNFSCSYNKLTSLAGAPGTVGGDFVCYNNNLTSLVGAPQTVGGNFECHTNELTSLEGAPQSVDGDFKCDAFTLDEGEWNLKGWLKLLKERSPKAKKLILTLISPEALNAEIAKDPAAMVMRLKKSWNYPHFKGIRDQLVWPGGYQDQAQLVGDLDTIGF